MRSLAALACAVVACGQPPRPHDRMPPAARKGARTITIIGTNDLHGALDRLPLFSGFVANVRAARAADGGSVVLLDAGDLFQGTLESNLAEGADVIKAYNQLGYSASAIGNHEFDYGPEGPQVTVKAADEDPRGALKARVGEAKFPFVVTNIFDDKSGERIKWPNMPASTMLDVAGTNIGVLGASTEQTPYTTMPANFVGLKMALPTAKYITAEAQALRARGAQVVVLVAHIGSACKDLDKPEDVSTCDRGEELFKVLGDVPKGLIDVVVAGHTHAAMAHRINGIAVIESYSSGRAFGRVDLRVTETHVSAVAIHKPTIMCPLDKEMNPAPVADCHPADYEGRPIVADPKIQQIVDDAIAHAGARRGEKLGITLAGPITKAYGTESVEGDWFTDLMLAARPDAQIALTNGGGLRADIPAGDLTYGQLFAAMPFDNRFAVVDLEGKHLRRLVTTNLQRGGGIFSWSGLTAKGRCKDGAFDVEIRVGAKALDDKKHYKLVTSDFLASGGDGVIGRLKLPEGAISPTDMIIRDAMADVLRTRKGTLKPEDIYNPASKKRMDYEGKRPVECVGARKPDKPEEPD